MDPQIQQFLILNGVVVLALVLYMAFGRSKRAPSRLKLRETEARDKLQVRDEVDFKNAPETSNRSERILNVVFQFNGHDFDAYQVLGVPAGSSLDRVEEAYKGLLNTTPEDSHPFLQIAFEAVKLKLTQL